MQGPSYEFRDLPRVTTETQKHVAFARLLADAGYNSEANRRFRQESLGIYSTGIACNLRDTERHPAGLGRRHMMQRFACKA